MRLYDLLSDREREWFHAKRRYPVLGTLREDGFPNLSVMWALVQPDGTILMNTRYDRQKGRDVARDPRVSLCFDDGYEYLTFEGRVTLRDDPTCVDITVLRDAYGDTMDFSPQKGQRVSLIMTVERVLRHLQRL